jgi:hypothetical protein
MIYNWKKSGLIYDDYDELYDVYINTMECQHCQTEFTEKNWRCLDHDHTTGLFRKIVCHRCNVHDSYIKYPTGYTAQEYYQANKEKIKEYYQANKEKIKEYQQVYRQANKQEYKKEYYQTNKEKRKEYYQANKEKIKEYYQANKEKNKEYQQVYRQANKDKPTIAPKNIQNI